MIDASKRVMDYPDYLGVLETARFNERDVQYSSAETVLSKAKGPRCPMCGFERNGWLRADLPQTHKYFGFLVRCPKCWDQVTRERYLQEFSRLSGGLRDMTYDNFRVLPGNKEALVACRSIANGTERGWATVWGGFGCGKTHLLAASINYAVGNGIPAAYYRMADLLAMLREGVSDGEVEERLERVCKTEVLAIDDADPGMVNMTPFSSELMLRLFESRYQSWDRGTLLAMHSPPRPSNEGPYGFLASRMLDRRNRVVEISSGDVRPKMS